MATSGWNYIYLDYDKITTKGSNKIDETCFINSTEEPAWNETKRGWYPSSDGTYVTVDDRCIFAVYSNATYDLEEWTQGGDGLILYHSPVYNSCVPSGWTSMTLKGPIISDKLQVISAVVRSAEDVTVRWRKSGSSALTGIDILKVSTGKIDCFSCSTVFTDYTKVIEIKLTPEDGTAGPYVTSTGYYLSKGI